MSIAIPILYEDNHLLVVRKPSNILSQADQSGDTDMLTVLKDMIKIRDQKPGNVYLGLVHRLDRMVGGAMVFAKTSKAAARLSDAVRTRKIEKTYWAVVHGVPKQPQNRLIHWLKKDAAKNRVQIVPAGSNDAKEAILDYEVLESVLDPQNHRNYSLLQIRLLTGRPHQIRAQCAAIGLPLFADTKYGSTVEHETIGLWAVQLEFEHPVTKQWLSFSSFPPSDKPWPFFASFRSKHQEN